MYISIATSLSSSKTKDYTMYRNVTVSIVLLAALLLPACNPTNPHTGSATVIDADGNVYHTIKIGSQTWTQENLRTTKFNDTTVISKVTDGAAWVNLSTPGFCFCNNTTNADTIEKFGALYNWYTIHTGRLAPAGWHVPADSDWDTLQHFLIDNGYNYDGTTTGNKIAQSLAARTDWSIDTTAGAIGKNLSANNSSGFSALPGGYRDYNGFINIGRYGIWWSATENVVSGAGDCSLHYNAVSLIRLSGGRSSGFSVRLVKD
jgi:uncharacterized protein (TIGR02145 family)